MWRRAPNGSCAPRQLYILHNVRNAAERQRHENKMCWIKCADVRWPIPWRIAARLGPSANRAAIFNYRRAPDESAEDGPADGYRRDRVHLFYAQRIQRIWITTNKPNESRTLCITGEIIDKSMLLVMDFSLVHRFCGADSRSARALCLRLMDTQ